MAAVEVGVRVVTVFDVDVKVFSFTLIGNEV